MTVLDRLVERWQGETKPFLVRAGESLTIDQLQQANLAHLDVIRPGDVVALIRGL